MSTYNYQDSLSSVKFLETTVLPQILSCHKKKQTFKSPFTIWKRVNETLL